ncbi:TRAP transporter substrate-binding protein DctP [Bacillus dakarensis]|uniref:TRAP transporter substrate-binding protein DctP n=1 Tax=Robertmurraya dakarensis TaxID=1926278 RepID=UPI0009812581|nr:TRAP transporter substrate-binding protein DctP [Bacillus dakarensis]
MKKIFSFVFLLIFASVAGCSQGAGTSNGSSEGSNSSKADVIEWDLSLWGGPREWTTTVEDWAEEMNKRTEGRWKITIHYGEAISSATDNLQGIEDGLFEAAAVAPMYTPGVLPLNEVIGLPFLSPLDHEHLSLFQKAAWEHPALLEELEQHNAVPLLHSVPSQYNYTGKVKIEKVEDFEGVRIAGMDASQGRVFEKFGAVPNPMPAPDLYSSLDRGTIDGVIFPYTYGHVAYGFHEVSKYTTTGIAAGTPASFYIANKAAWDALPDDIKEIHNEYMNDWHKISSAPYYEADEKNLPMFKENLEHTELPESERQKLLDASEEIWQEWVDKYADRGPTQDILDYMLEKRNEIAGF